MFCLNSIFLSLSQLSYAITLFGVLFEKLFKCGQSRGVRVELEKPGIVCFDESQIVIV